jgi:hypothetical protein
MDDPFSRNRQQHEAFKRSAVNAASRLMLVALDEELPLPQLTKAANVAGPVMRGLLQRHRTPARLFHVTTYLVRRIMRAQRRLRVALLQYAHLRRLQIKRCLDAWEATECHAHTEVSFLEFALCHVPSDLKRRVVVAHRAESCHRYIRDLRQFKAERATRLAGYYERAFALRTVSSRSSRIVRSFVELTIQSGGPGTTFPNATVRALVGTAALLAHSTSLLQRMVDSSLHVRELGDLQLQEVAEACRAIESSPAAPARDVVLGSLGFLRVDALSTWCAERLQHEDDLPPQPFDTCPALHTFSSRLLVPRQVNLRDRNAVMAMNEIFLAAWRARARVARRQRQTKSTRSLLSKSNTPGNASPSSSPKAADITSAIQRELAARTDAATLAHDQRLLDMAARTVATTNFERRVCLVGDAWVDDPIWHCAVAKGPPAGRPFCQLRADLRHNGGAQSQALKRIVATRARLECLESRVLSCHRLPPRKPRVPAAPSPRLQPGVPAAVVPSRPQTAPRSASRRYEVQQAVPQRRHTTEPILVVQSRRPEDETGFTVGRASLIPRGMSSAYPYPMLRPYLEAPVPTYEPQPGAQTIARRRFRGMDAIGRQAPPVYK